MIPSHFNLLIKKMIWIWMKSYFVFTSCVVTNVETIWMIKIKSKIFSNFPLLWKANRNTAMTEIQIFEKKKKKNEEFFSLLVENHLPITWRIKNLFLLITNNWKEEGERRRHARLFARQTSIIVAGRPDYRGPRWEFYWLTNLCTAWSGQ